MIHVSLGAMKNCVNPDSYGVICVRCNQCGRFDADKPQPKPEPIRIEYSEEGKYPTICYGDGKSYDAFICYRICPYCGRFVKADKQSRRPEYSKGNATCKKHGRVQMPLLGYLEDLEG